MVVRSRTARGCLGVILSVAQNRLLDDDVVVLVGRLRLALDGARVVREMLMQIVISVDVAWRRILVN